MPADGRWDLTRRLKGKLRGYSACRSKEEANLFSSVTNLCEKVSSKYFWDKIMFILAQGNI